jgi:hypothetical protein
VTITQISGCTLTLRTQEGDRGPRRVTVGSHILAAGSQDSLSTPGEEGRRASWYTAISCKRITDG